MSGDERYGFGQQMSVGQIRVQILDLNYINPGFMCSLTPLVVDVQTQLDVHPTANLKS